MKGEREQQKSYAHVSILIRLITSFSTVFYDCGENHQMLSPPPPQKKKVVV